MRPRNYTDEGIVLARRSYGEADRILSVYTLNHGRVSLIAKGVRKPSSRKRGHIEVFGYVHFSAAHGKSLDLMTEVEVIDAFSEVRKNLKKVSVAYYFMEAIGRTTHEGEPNRELFGLVLEYLNHLKAETSLKKLRLEFIYYLLSVLGFWPRGKPLLDPDAKLEEVTERRMSSARVGKRLVA